MMLSRRAQMTLGALSMVLLGGIIDRAPARVLGLVPDGRAQAR